MSKCVITVKKLFFVYFKEIISLMLIQTFRMQFRIIKKKQDRTTFFFQHKDIVKFFFSISKITSTALQKIKNSLCSVAKKPKKNLEFYKKKEFCTKTEKKPSFLCFSFLTILM